MSNKPKVELKIDERYESKDETYPIVLYVYYNGKKKLHPLGWTESVGTLNYWLNRQTKGQKMDTAGFEKFKTKVHKYRERIKALLQTIPDGQFSIDGFIDLWKKPDAKDTSTVKGAFEEYINTLTKEDHIGTAISYQQACNSIEKFKRGLLLKDVTKDLLNDYQRSMVKEKKSLTTVGIYLRSLRTIMNYSMEKGTLDTKDYPFGKYKYVIPKGSNKKKSLSDDQIRQILNFVPVSESLEEKALDYWKFVYMGNGMNPKDLCNLKYSDIKGDRIYFIREKTKHTTQGDTKVIEVNYTPELKRIVEKYGTHGKKDDYIFPVFTKDMTEVVKKDKVQNFAKVVRQGLQKIADDLKIEEKINFMSARHSFATRLMRSKAPFKFISDSLGHKNLTTTENYLAGFDQKEVEKFSGYLTDF